MINNDYLACEGYSNQPAYSNTNGFSAFFNETEKKFFFAFLDKKGKVLFRSEGYPTEKARATGIASVVKNSPIAERYSVIEENGQFLVILKAGNNKEIARSCELGSQKEATAFVKTIEKTVLAYAKEWSGEVKAVVEAPKVVEKVVAKKVETPKAVEKAVSKKVEAPKAVETKATKVVTKIVETPKAIKTVAPKVETPKAVETKAPVAKKTTKKVDLFLNDEAYLGHPTLTDEYGTTGFALFEGNDKKYYFSVYEADGSIFQRSVGFDSPEVRNEQFEALKSAIINEESYKVAEIEGQYFAQIVDGKGTELSRSVGFDSFVQALLKTPKGWAKEEFVGTLY